MLYYCGDVMCRFGSTSLPCFFGLHDETDSGGGGFKRYFEEIATVLKKHFPDVIIDREIVEV